MVESLVGVCREFKIKCKGVGVHPPMELSDQVVHFKATALNDYSINNIYIVNNHLSTNEYTHPVPRIGRFKYNTWVGSV